MGCCGGDEKTTDVKADSHKGHDADGQTAPSTGIPWFVAIGAVLVVLVLALLLLK